MRQHFEFSKIIVKRALAIFLVHTILTLAVIFLKPVSAVHAVSLVNAVVPLYIVIFGGYFGKAGLENLNKIRYGDAQKMTETNEDLVNPSQIDG